ncbi:YtcA family lipoprotein [Edaphobacter aggregans]|uniref:YtcA family lipoprotein n=1 Tax=Edaphobacter aggregans TaxID=570835 RepID=UPI000555F5DE|nr:YtcA family lipoprotein [Edaphobacter aggregans]
MSRAADRCRLWTATAVLLTTCGCSVAPAFDVMGSLFPAWLFCIAVGALLAVITRWLLLRYRISLLFPMLAYPCLAAVFTLAIWLVFF